MLPSVRLLSLEFVEIHLCLADIERIDDKSFDIRSLKLVFGGWNQTGK
jgi:hypothetical protein